MYILVECYINKGSGVVKFRFELSTLPEHAKEPTLVIRFLEVFSDTGGMFYSRLIWYHSRTHEGQLFPRLPLGRVEVWNYPLDRRKDGTACKEFILNYRELYVTVDHIAAKYFYSIFTGTNYRTEEFCQFPVQYKS